MPKHYRAGVRWNAEQLQSSELAFIATWPSTLRRSVRGLGEVLFCHATPRNPHDIFTRLMPEQSVLALLGDFEADLIVCGHTHMQFERRIGCYRVVNAGSVGMPFGQPGAYWILIGPEVEFRHTAYDTDDAASRIRLTRYPEAEAFAAQNVLQPPSEEEMLRAFNQT